MEDYKNECLFFTRSKTLENPPRLTIRVYAEDEPNVNLKCIIANWLKEHFDFLEVLPSVRVNMVYEFEKDEGSHSDIAVLFMRENEWARRSLLEDFNVLSKDVREQAAKTLVINYAIVPEETTKPRKALYEKEIDNLVVEYIEYANGWWLSNFEKEFPVICDYIKKFILQCKENDDSNGIKMSFV